MAGSWAGRGQSRPMGWGRCEKAQMALERQEESLNHHSHGKTSGFIFCLANNEQKTSWHYRIEQISEQEATCKNTFKNGNSFVVISKVLQSPFKDREPRGQGPRGLGIPANSVLEEKPPNKQNGAIT